MAIEDDILKSMRNIESIITDAAKSMGTNSQKQTRKQATVGKRDAVDTKMEKVLRRSMASMSDDLDELGKQTRLVTRGVEVLADEVDGSSKALRGFTANVNSASSALVQFTKNLGGSPTQTPNISTPRSVGNSSGGFLSGLLGGIASQAAKLLPTKTPGAQAAQALIAQKLNIANVRAIGSLGVLGATLGVVANTAGQLANQFLTLSRYGVDGSIGSLVSLNLKALTLGMTFQEYANLIEKNAVLAARSKSLQAFGDQVGRFNERFRALGVGAKEATETVAALDSLAVSVGVPFSEVDSVTSPLIEQFKSLRGQIGITATAFSAMVSTVLAEDSVRRELIGLDGADRASRMAIIAQNTTNIAALKADVATTKALTAEMIKSRSQNTVTRFTEAQRLRQAAANLGLNTGDRLAQLNLKGRNRTSDEESEFRRLLAPVAKGVVEMQGSQSLQISNIGDQLQQGLGGVFGYAEQAARGMAVGGGQGLGRANEDFTKEVGAVAQAVIRLGDILGPLASNPIISGAMDIGKIAAAVVASTAITRMFSGGAAAAAGGGIARAGMGLAGALGTGLVSLVSGALKVLKVGAIFAPLVGAVTEMFTGNLQALFGGGALRSTIFAAGRAFLTAIPELFDFVLNAIGIESTVTNWVDGWIAKFSAFAFKLGSSISGWLAGISFLPDSVQKFFADDSAKLKEQGAKFTGIAGALASDSKATMTSLGAQAAMRSQGLDLKGRQPGVSSQPGSTGYRPLTPPAVNSAETPTTAPLAAAKAAAVAQGLDETTTDVFNQMLLVLKDVLAAELRQNELAARLTAQTAGSAFSDSEQTMTKALKGR